MLVFNVSDFSKRAAEIFDVALTNEVIISNNGTNYRILPLQNKKGVSPFENIPTIKLNITTQEIVELVKESRAGM